MTKQYPAVIKYPDGTYHGGNFSFNPKKNLFAAKIYVSENKAGVTLNSIKGWNPAALEMIKGATVVKVNVEEI